jgi:6-phospho-beta-glucosidase
VVSFFDKDSSSWIVNERKERIMKVTVIGGGSTYTPELINGFIQRVGTFPLSELSLMDVDRERLEIVGGFARRMVAENDDPFKVSLNLDQCEALSGADYVITQLRVGQMPARRNDEYLGQRHGLVGQETTGVGGMAKALRTIPVILEIARDMNQVSEPGAWLVNFTNPSGLVTQALSKYAPGIKSVGVCNVAINTKLDLLEVYRAVGGKAVDPGNVELNTLGLNHLSWHRGLVVNGVDVWQEVLRGFLDDLRKEEKPEWDIATLEALGMIPNYYLRYYYNTDQVLEEQSHWPPSRAEEVLEIEKDLLQEYADPDLTVPPEDLMLRGGAYYSTVATQLLNAIHNDQGEVHVVNTVNNGAVKSWPDDWVLELPARVNRKGIQALPAEPLPPACFGLLAAIKSYELLTADAAVSGDRQKAFQALLVHPLGPRADKITEVLADLLETNRQYLPAFFGEK